MLPRKKQNRYQNSHIVNLFKQCSVLRTELFNGTTCMKAQLIAFSINRLLKSEMAKVGTRHNKKMDNLLSLKQAIDGLQENPNDVILNLSGQDLSDDQIDVLKLGLRHSFATRPGELEMMSISGDLWDQINKLDQFKDGSYIKDRLKNSLRSFTYNYLNLDLQFHIDNKHIRILRSLNTKFAILKPDKGKMVLSYLNAQITLTLNSLFNGPTKFKRIPHGLISSRLAT